MTVNTIPVYSKLYDCEYCPSVKSIVRLWILSQCKVNCMTVNTVPVKLHSSTTTHYNHIPPTPFYHTKNVTFSPNGVKNHFKKRPLYLKHNPNPKTKKNTTVRKHNLNNKRIINSGIFKISKMLSDNLSAIFLR